MNSNYIDNYGTIHIIKDQKLLVKSRSKIGADDKHYLSTKKTIIKIDIPSEKS